MKLQLIWPRFRLSPSSSPHICQCPRVSSLASTESAGCPDSIGLWQNMGPSAHAEGYSNMADRKIPWEKIIRRDKNGKRTDLNLDPPWSPPCVIEIYWCPPHQIIRFIMRQNKCCHWWKVHIALLQLSHALASSHSRQCVVHLQTMCHMLPKSQGPMRMANVRLSQVSSLPLCALDRPFLPVPWSHLHISNMFAATLTLLRVWLQVGMKIKFMLLPQSKYCS